MSTALYQTRFVWVVGTPSTKRVYAAKLAPGVAAAPSLHCTIVAFLGAVLNRLLALQIVHALTPAPQP
jgi:hypothetical protein